MFATVPCSLFDFYRELPVVTGRLSGFLEQQGSSVEQLNSQTSVREWQKTLLTLTLLAKKYKVWIHGLPD